MRRPGIALVSVLWVLAVGGAVALSIRVRGRAGFEAARNRATLTQAAWRAAGCVSIAATELEIALSSTSEPDQQDGTWHSLDEVALRRTNAEYPDCIVHVESAERTFNVNMADEDALIAFFARELGADSARRVAKTLLDWVDSDDSARPFGSREEVRSVLGPGFDSTIIADLSIAGTLVDVGHASARVLRTIPGITEATAEGIVRSRRSGRRLVDPRELFDIAPPPDAQVLREHFAVTASRLALTPRAWQVRAVVTSADGLSRTEELTLGRNGPSLLTVGRQVW